MSMIKKIAAGVLAACMAISCTACSNTSWVYKTETSTLDAGVYIAMLANAYMGAIQEVSSNTSDTNASIWDMTIGETDTRTYMINNAKESATSYLAVKDKFDELKLTLTEEDKTSIETSADQMWSYYNMMINFEESGASKDSYVEFLTTNTRQNKIFDHYYGKGGTEEVKDNALKKYYYKNYATAKIVAIPLTDAEGALLTDDAEIKKLENKAKGYQKRLNNGENPDKIINEYNKEVQADAEELTGDDNLSVLNDDGSALSNKVFKTKVDGVFYVKDSTNGYIYVGKKFNIRNYENIYQEVRDSVLHGYKDADFQAMVDEWTKAATVTANDAAVKRYDPKNLVIVESAY